MQAESLSQALLTYYPYCIRAFPAAPARVPAPMRPLLCKRPKDPCQKLLSRTWHRSLTFAKLFCGGHHTRTSRISAGLDPWPWASIPLLLQCSSDRYKLRGPRVEWSPCGLRRVQLAGERRRRWHGGWWPKRGYGERNRHLAVSDAHEETPPRNTTRNRPLLL